MMTSNEFIKLGKLETARKFKSAYKLERWRHYGDIADAYTLQLVEMAQKETIIDCGVKKRNVMISMSPDASSVLMSSHQWV
jgi:hypothetical protein